MDKKTIRTLINKDEIESCFVTSKTHKNYWYYNNKKIKRILPMMKMYSSRHKKTNFIEDTGLASASRASWWRNGKRIGNKIEIIECDNFETSIDIHSKFDLYLGEKTIEYFKKFETITENA